MYCILKNIKNVNFEWFIQLVVYCKYTSKDMPLNINSKIWSLTIILNQKSTEKTVLKKILSQYTLFLHFIKIPTTILYPATVCFFCIPIVPPP